MTSTTDSPRRTALGSPCSPVWDDAHIAVVEAAESRIGARICGARTLTGRACELPPDHENGRCRFHGGFNLTGAQPGNRNAVIHGLYSRAIQTCGEHCPMWNSCPCAGPDVARLDPKDRPKCPYEIAHYNAVLSDAQARADVNPYTDSLTLHSMHNAAMLQVMLLRAAAALAARPLVEYPETDTQAPQQTPARISPHLLAFTRISNECRRYALSLNIRSSAVPTDFQQYEHARRHAVDTSLLPEHQAALHAPRPDRRERSFRKIEFAVRSFKYRSVDEAREHLHEARALDNDYVRQMIEPDSPFHLEGAEILLPLLNGP